MRRMGLFGIFKLVSFSVMVKRGMKHYIFSIKIPVWKIGVIVS